MALEDLFDGLNPRYNPEPDLIVEDIDVGIRFEHHPEWKQSLYK